MLTRRVRIQLIILATLMCVTGAYILIHLVKLPAALFGVGRYTVTMQLDSTGGLYPGADVTYRGTEVGRVKSVKLTNTGVAAQLSLKSEFAIPSDLRAEVHSQTAIGEQYVELLPRNGTSPTLKNGDVIPLAATSVPPDINSLLAAANAGLRAIPHDNLQTVIDESYTAVGGLGTELSRIVSGGATLAIDARKNLGPLVALIDGVQPVLDSQTDTSGAIQAWAAHLATVTKELQIHDQAVAGVVDNGAPALGEARRLVERLQPTLPTLLANLVSVGQVGLTYRNDIEELLTLLPQLIANQQAAVVANANTKEDYASFYINLALNLNVPPPCLTGYLPTQQKRSFVLEDTPDNPPGIFYCRVPQDAQIDVRGARNTPCETRPGKRAATVKLCESDKDYVPLNDGYNWKGDPNATETGQSVPELPPGSPPVTSAAGAPMAAGLGLTPPIGTSGSGPEGKQSAPPGSTQVTPTQKAWQNMLLPPPGS